MNVQPLKKTQWGDRKISSFLLKAGFLFALGFGIYEIQANPLSLRHTREAPPLAFHAELLKPFTLGFELVAADSLWLRVIQDIDYKDPGHNSKGWVFQMLDGITTLDHRFRIAYSAGSTVLSVLVQDIEGARLLFERAIANFPKDWSLNYRAGYHYLYEVKDCRRAAELFQVAVDNGAPPWVSSLIGRLYIATGQYEIAESVLKESLKKFQGTEVEPRIRERLKDLEARKTSNAGPLANCQPPK